MNIKSAVSTIARGAHHSFSIVNKLFTAEKVCVCARVRCGVGSATVRARVIRVLLYYYVFITDDICENMVIHNIRHVRRPRNGNLYKYDATYITVASNIARIVCIR